MNTNEYSAADECAWTEYPNALMRALHDRVAEMILRDSYQVWRPPAPKPNVYFVLPAKDAIRIEQRNGEVRCERVIDLRYGVAYSFDGY